jgi:hypothetical protein
MARLKATKEAISSLASICLVGDLTITLAVGEGALFPAAGDFMLRIGTGASYEIVRATARTDDTITITRACDDTVAIEHAEGAAVWTVVSHSYLDDLWSALDTMVTAADTVATHDVTTANDTAETTVYEVAETGNHDHACQFSLASLVTAAEGGTVTIRWYTKGPDETNYVLIAKSAFIIGSDDVHPSVEIHMTHHYLKCTIQCSNDVTTTRTISYVYLVRDLE